MNYCEVLDFMFNSLPMYQRIGQAAYKTGLDNSYALNDYFNHPHKHFKTIHIAGTNGKGSVAHSLASILQEAGYKTGLYTSPHLLDYRERIKVNGQMIPKDFVTDFINDNVRIISKLKPSFFEMSVALAFEYFRYCNVNIAVVETGMGGRLDSTNIINPILTVITNIGFDHTQFLGNSLEKIAHEKAGIIKNKIPSVIGETQKETSDIFIEKAYEMVAPIYFADNYYNVTLTEAASDCGNYCVKTKSESYDLEFGLIGIYQQKNLSTILKSVEILNRSDLIITNENLRNGLKKIRENTGLRGRWEIIGHQPLIICDTGHNKDGLKYVINQLLQQKFKRLHIIIGFVNDKNISELLTLLPKNAGYYFAQASIPRAMPSVSLKNIALEYHLHGNCFDDVITAFNAAKSVANKDDVIFIGGSSFVVGDLLSHM